MFFGLFGVDKEKTDHGHEPAGQDAYVEHSAEGSLPPEDIGQVALDVIETQDAMVIVAPLAGVPQGSVDINLSRNILTISGKREKPKAFGEGRALVSECFFGPFSRSVILPENLGLNRVRATMEDNMLIVTLPKLVSGSKSVKIERFSSNEPS